MLSDLRLVLPIALFSILLSIQTRAQEYYGDEASRLVDGSERVIVNNERNTISFIQLSEGYNQSEQESIEWLRSALGMEDNESFDLIKVEDDQIGFTHYRYRQMLNGVPVEYGVYYVHTQNSTIVSANGERYTVNEVITTPGITSESAFNIAMDHFGIQDLRIDDMEEVKLMIFPVRTAAYKLVYKVDMFALNNNKRSYIYVDAHDGSIVEEYSRIIHAESTATALTMYNDTVMMETDSLSPSSYRLRDYSRGAGIETYDLNTSTNKSTAVDFTDADNFWNTTTNLDNTAYDVHYGTQVTYDFFLNNFGWNSYDNAGSVVKSYVHYNSDYVNAFWNGTELTYGDGDGIEYNPLTSLEIVAHEFVHGVTEYTADLIYSGESGALNESFSDIFGATIKFNENPGIASWYSGDQIVIPGSGATPFRNMADPNEFGSPDTYGGDFWDAGDIVHFNSGVQNFWYYLLVEGGTGVNDNGHSYTVNAIDMDDAISIVARNLSVYLTPSSTFADARTGAIQSAIDLFGSCSNQVIQVTNAWHAVGVGNQFSDAVVAGFILDRNFHCILPATVNFSNSSINASSYNWDFGDGSTSTLANPSHVYDSAGTYTVTLIATGTALCGSSDTMIRNNIVSVTDGGGPVAPLCTPTTSSTCCGIGIRRVTIGSIDKVSGDATEGYQDFTCSDFTTIVAGDAVPISINTDFTESENVHIYIDYDGDGTMNSTNELVFSSQDKIGNHSGIIHTPLNALTTSAVRMRVIDDENSNTITGSCHAPVYGQAEDYTINFISNSSPPQADFTSDLTSVVTGSSVEFSDLSVNAPTSWQWSFPGGTPSVSTQRNPTVQYPMQGIYPVELIVNNGFGADTILKTEYISVVTTFNMCSAPSSTTALNGILLDSGGETGIYSSGENCFLLIQPNCADSIILSFESFQTESCCDRLRVYDGTSTSDLQLLVHSGSSIPADVTATSGSMYITFNSDGSVTSSGFKAIWTTKQLSTEKPVASFSISDSTPPLLSHVQFVDLSTNSPVAWYWDLGDGSVSNEQNPVHIYHAPGLYTVSLISFSCQNSDTVSYNINVQQAPDYSSFPDSIKASFTQCSDSTSVLISIVNSGLGDLAVKLTDGQGSQTGGGTNLEVLALTYGTDLSREYPNTIDAINTYFTDYNLTEINTTSANDLQNALIGKDVFLMPEMESSSTTVFTQFAPVLQNFVNSGGKAIICGTYSTQAQAILNTGLISGTHIGTANSSALNVVDPAHPIMESIPSSFSGVSATSVFDIVNANKIPLVESNSNDVVTVIPSGLGVVVYVGFDFFTSTHVESYKILGQAFQWVNDLDLSLPEWLSVLPDSSVVKPGDTLSLQLSISAENLVNGSYYSNLVIETNDPDIRYDTIHVSVGLDGPAEIVLEDTCVHFNTVLMNATDTQAVSIYNIGCDTLEITSVTSSIPEFSPVIPGGSAQILPGDSIILLVDFTPSAVSNYSGTITILNNDSNKTICLSGAGAPAPLASIQPDSIYVATNSCNDIIEIPIHISNIGGLPLELVLSDSSESERLKVLMLTYGVDVAQEGTNTINAINLYFSDYDLTTINTTNPITLANALNGKDVVLIPEIESGSTGVISNLSPVLQTFVNNGGSAVVCLSSAPKLASTGLFSFGSSNEATLQIYVTGSHPISEGVSSPFSAPNATGAFDILSPGAIPIVTNSVDWSVVSTWPFGNGQVVFIGFDYYLFNLSSSRIIGNTFKWLSEKSNGDWLSLDTTSLNLASGDSGVVTLTVNGTGIPNGTYESMVQLFTNEPANPVRFIPVKFVVNGKAELVVIDSCIVFDTILQGTSTFQDLDIVNSGCDTLYIYELDPSSSLFSFDVPLPFIISPFDTFSVPIEFSSSFTGSYNETVEISSNTDTIDICLIGNVLPASSIEVIPGFLTGETINCDDTVSIPFQVVNSGSADLTVEVSDTQVSNSNDLELLVISYGADLSREYPNTFTALNDHFTNYNLSVINTTDSLALANALVGKDVFLMTSPIGNPSVYTEFATPLQDFVSDGGVVVFCGIASSTYDDCIFNTGLFSGSYYYNADFNTITVLNNHPITKGLPISFSGPNNTAVYNLNEPDRTTLIEYGTRDVVTLREIGNGTVVYIGFDYFDINSYNSLVIGNTFKWIRSKTFNQFDVTNNFVTIAPGDTFTNYLNLYGSGFLKGTYEGTLSLETNTPSNPVFNIDFEFTINGTPEITVSDSCLDFGSILRNTSKTDSLFIMNRGCDTLFISSVSSNLPEFYPVNFSPVIIAPNDSAEILVKFSPLNTGQFSGILSIENNGVDTSICLNGYVTPASEFVYFPDPVVASTVECNDTVTVPVYIVNTGDTTLEVSLDTTFRKTLEVLALTYGADLSREYPNTISAINQNFTNYNLTEINTTIADTLAHALVGKDVLLIPEVESGAPSVFLTLAPVLQDFVSSGGTAVFCHSSTTTLTNTGLFTLGSNCSSGAIYVSNSHPIGNDVITPFSGPSATGYLNIINPGAIPIATTLGGNCSVVSTWPFGTGDVVYIGFDFYNTNSSTIQLMGNTFQWIDSRSFDQYEIDQNSISLAPGDTFVNHISFYGSGNPQGTYNGTLGIETNDPLNFQSQIEFEFTINGSPKISVTDSCLIFGSILRNTSKTDSFLIANTGCDSLFIHALSSSIPEFAPISNLPIDIAVGDTAYILVEFSPTMTSDYIGDLSIVSNSNDTSICLKGKATPAPSLEFFPDTITVSTVECDDTVTVPIYIVNTGDTTLHVNLDTAGSIRLDVLALTYGVDLSREYPNTISAINQHFTNYNLKEINTTSPSVLASELAGIDVILIPEIETGSASVFLSFAPVLQNFVNNGGSAVFTNSATNILLNTGLFNLGGSCSTGTIQVSSAHPIGDGVFSPFAGPSSTRPRDILNSGAIPIATMFSCSVVSTWPFGLGNVVYVGFDYYNTNSSTNQLIGNTFKWLSSTVVQKYQVLTESLSIAPGDTIIDSVRFTISGLNTGLYTGMIFGSSNDVNNTSFELNYELNVIGSPEISLSDACINFGSISNYTGSTDSFTIFNNGCDTLNITSLVFSDSAFSSQPSMPINVLPYDSLIVKVSFNPTSTGSYSEILTILSNDNNVTLCLTGFASEPPSIEILVDTVHVTLCNDDSVLVPVEIVNNGGADLIVAPQVFNEAADLEVLALTYGVDLSWEYPNTLSAINAFFTDYNLTQVNTTNPATLATELIGKDVLLLPEPEDADCSIMGSFGPAILNFVNSGGTVVMCGVTGSTNSLCIFNTAVFSGTYYANANGDPLTVLGPHPITDGIPDFLGMNATPVYDITNPNKQTLISYNDRDVVAVRQIGNGKAVYIGFDYYTSTNYQANRVIGQTFQWISTYTNRTVFSSQDTIVIASGDTGTIDLWISGEEFDSIGTYLTSLTINSNDPFNTSSSLFVSIEVGLYGLVGVDPGCLNFDSVHVGSTAIDSFPIYNLGCSQINITGINSSNPVFSLVGISSISLESGDTSMVKVIFKPIEPGPVNASISILNTVLNKSVCVSGVGLDCPEPDDLLSVPQEESAILSWDQVPVAVSYTIFGKQIGTNTIVDFTTNTNPLTVNGLQANKSYTWAVRSNCSQLISPLSEPDTFTTLPPACLAPGNPVESNITANSVTLSWEPVPYAVNYVIRGTADVWNKANAVYLQSTNNSVSINGLDPDRTYYWQVQSICNNTATAVSPYSHLSNFTTMGIGAKTSETGGRSETSSKELLIFPNPAMDNVTVAVTTQFARESDEEYFIEVFDLKGTLMFKDFFFNNLDIDISTLPAGVYQIKVTSNEDAFKGKLLIH